MTTDWPFLGLEMGAYGVILADPPWSFRTRTQKGLGRSPQAHYACMDLPAIQRLPVAGLAARDCALVLWATAPMLPQALATMDAWGFLYKTGGAWAKQSSTGTKWAFGTGYVLRSASEFFLIGTRGHPKPKTRNVRNLIVAPVREHSRKPDDMRASIEALWAGPYCELFAREAASGWDCWGNDTAKFGIE